MKTSFKSVSILLLLVLAVSVSFGIRHLAGLFLLGPAYNPLIYTPAALTAADPTAYFFQPDAVLWDEEHAYARYITQILRGDWAGNTLQTYTRVLPELIQNPKFAALSTRFPFFFDRLGSAFLASLAVLTGGNVPLAFALADFIFPALLAAVCLAFCFQLRPTLSFALLGTGLFLWFNLPDVVTLVNMLLGGFVHGEVTFLRTPEPQVPLLTFLLFLFALLRVTKQPKLLNSLWLGVFLALNIYTYIYSWLLAFALLFAFFGILVLGARFFPPVPAGLKRALLIGGGIGLLLGAPALLSYALNVDIARDLSARFASAAPTHMPDISRTILLLLILSPALLPPVRAWSNRAFWIAFWLGGIIVINLQVITGRPVQTEHWTAYYFETFVLIYGLDLGLALWEQLAPKLFISRSTVWLRYAALVVLVLGFVSMSGRLVWAATVQRDYNARNPEFAALISYLAVQPPDSEIYTADPYLFQVLPAYEIQHFLPPIYLDPMTDEELAFVRQGTEKLVASAQTEPPASASIPLLVIVNRHKDTVADPGGLITFQNTDFVVRRLYVPLLASR